jgi:hypothetical protein
MPPESKDGMDPSTGNDASNACGTGNCNCGMCPVCGKHDCDCTC